MKTRQASKLDKTILYSTVSLTGAAVMIIELLGTRIIGPFYGVSLYVWSALISVTLIALAAGYFLGGRLADSRLGFRLSHAISLAALFTAAIPLLSDGVLLATDALGIRAGALASAVLLFFIPLTLLAMVGPFVITLAAEKLDNVGTVSGSVYAISTCGSVLGTLLLGFYLLPQFGSRSIVDVLSLLLVLLAIGTACYEKQRNTQGSVIFVLPAGLIALVMLAFSHAIQAQDQTSKYRQLSAKESIYGWVRVIDEPEQEIRWLMSDASTIGSASLLTGDGLLQYQHTIKQLPNYHPHVTNALLIGLGTGHLATAFNGMGIVTDTIEINPAVADAAKRYFKFKPVGKFIIGDARYQVRQLHKKYDFIIHDCFTGGTDPAYLLTREMFQDLRSRLKPGGILALNLVGFLRGEESNGTIVISRTLKQAFQ